MKWILFKIEILNTGENNNVACTKYDYAAPKISMK